MCRRSAGTKCGPGGSALSVALPLIITRPMLPDGTRTKDAASSIQSSTPMIGMTRMKMMIQPTRSLPSLRSCLADCWLACVHDSLADARSLPSLRSCLADCWLACAHDSLADARSLPCTPGRRHWFAQVEESSAGSRRPPGRDGDAHQARG